MHLFKINIIPEVKTFINKKGALIKFLNDDNIKKIKLFNVFWSDVAIFLITTLTLIFVCFFLLVFLDANNILVFFLVVDKFFLCDFFLFRLLFFFATINYSFFIITFFSKFKVG